MAVKDRINQLFLTELCNLNCLFCSYDRSNINPVNISIDKLQSIIKESPSNTEQVVIDGGEPTIRKDFFNIIEIVKKNDPKKIVLCTNGLMLSYPKFAKKIKESRIDQVLVSLHSHNSEISDEITRVNGAFEKTVKGIKNLLALNVKVMLSFVICKLNCDDLTGYVKFVDKELQQSHITFSFVMPSGNALRNKWIVPKISDVTNELKKALTYCLNNGITFAFTGCSIPPCFLKGFEEYTGEFLLSNKEFVLERESGSRLRHVEDGKIKPESCKKCKYDSICGGLWEEYVKIYGFDEIK